MIVKAPSLICYEMLPFKPKALPKASFVCTVGDGCTLDGVAWTVPSDVFGVVWKEPVLTTLCVSDPIKEKEQNALPVEESE